MAADSFSKFLIEIGVDKASWDATVARFKKLERTEKQLKKQFMDFGKTTKSVFKGGAAYIKAFNEQLKRTLILTRQLRSIPGFGAKRISAIAASQQAAPLTLQNIGGVQQLPGIGPKLTGRLKADLSRRLAQENEMKKAADLALFKGRRKMDKALLLAQIRDQQKAEAIEAFRADRQARFAAARKQPRSRRQPLGTMMIARQYSDLFGYSQLQSRQQILPAGDNQTAALMQALTGKRTPIKTAPTYAPGAASAIRATGTNEAAAAEQEFKNLSKVYETKQKIATSSTAGRDANKQNADINEKVLRLNEKIRVQQRLRAVHAQRAAQHAKTDADISKRATMKEINAEGKLNTLVNKRKNLLIQQSQLARSAAREFPDSELTAAMKKLDKLRAGLAKVQRSTESDTVKKRIGGLQRELDLVESGLTTTRSRKEFNLLTKEIDKGTVSLRNMESAHKKMSKNVGRRQGIINTGFGSFSIIMSGIAATLFVFQEILQFVRLILQPTMEANKAWSKLFMQVQGSTEQLKQFYQAALQADIAGAMKIGEATDLLIKFKNAGFTYEESLERLRITTDAKLEATAGSWAAFFDGISAKIRDIMRAKGTVEGPGFGEFDPFFYGAENVEPYQGSYKRETEIEQTYIINNKKVVGTKNAIDALNRESKDITALNKALTTIGLRAPEGRFFDQRTIRNAVTDLTKALGTSSLGEENAKTYIEAYEKILQNIDWRRAHQKQINAQRNAFDKLGKESEGYFAKERRLIENEYDRQRLLMDDTLARRLADMKLFNLKMKEERAKALDFGPNTEDIIKKSFAETKIATPGYVKILQQDLADRQKRLSQFGTTEAKEQAPLIQLKGELEIYKTIQASKLGVDEQFARKSKILTDQLYKTREEIIIRERDILIEIMGDKIQATEITNRRLEQLDRERAASFAKLYAAGGSVAEGFKAYLYNLEATQQTVAQRWQQRFTQMFAGAEQSVQGFFFTFFQSEMKSLSDAFKSLGDSFKSMIDRMAADWLASNVMRLVFGQMHTAGAGPGLIGALGGLFGGGAGGTTTATAPLPGGGLPAQLAEGGPVSANRTYLVGERGPELFVPRQSGQIKNQSQMGSLGEASVKVIINNSTGSPAKVTESTGPDQTRNLIVSLGAGDINSGGPMAKAIENTYGLRRTGRMI